jgi:hypothetical protein
MDKKSLWKLLVIIAIPILISVFPAPEGLTKLAWVLSGIYLAAIVGLVIKPRTGCLVNRRGCLYGGDRQFRRRHHKVIERLKRLCFRHHLAGFHSPSVPLLSLPA